MIGLIIVSVILFIVLLLSIQFLFTKKLKSLENRHVIITGGSSGIGKCVAIECARLGANITIIARDINKLEQAKSEISKCCKNQESQRVQYLSLDLSSSYEAVEEALCGAERDLGPIYMLINCAGMAICGKLEDMDVKDLKLMIDINYYGTAFPTKAVLPGMKSRGEGFIVITASQAALLGLFGYSAYAASKFALRGLAESIAMECKPHGVKVTLSLPPDTDTPGFEIENRTKPLETKLISAAGGLTTPEAVAKQLLTDALTGKFFSVVGFEGWITAVVCCGASPWMDLITLPLQILLMGPLRLLFSGVLVYFNIVIKRCMKKRDSNKKSH